MTWFLDGDYDDDDDDDDGWWHDDDDDEEEEEKEEDEEDDSYEFCNAWYIWPNCKKSPTWKYLQLGAILRVITHHFTILLRREVMIKFVQNYPLHSHQYPY